MKHQYFADRRDFVKYELLLDLVTLVPGPPKLVFVPMLTPPDGTSEGRVVHFEQGKRRASLYRFLRDTLAEGNRDLRLLRAFMLDTGVDLYLHSIDNYFRHEGRAAYFACIPTALLTSGVVFLDPDIGLETGTLGYMRRKGIEKYLFYDDVRAISERAGEGVIIVMYQHLQNDKGKILGDLATRGRRLSDKLDRKSIGYVTDRDVAFLAYSKSPTLHSELLVALERHASLHQLDFGVLSD